MENVKVGIVGIGNIGFIHAKKLYAHQVEGFTLTAICDSNPKMEAVAGESFPGTAFYGDYKEMFRKADIDAVIVAVPHPSHSDVAIDAFACGKHVLIEKPMDITLSKGKLLCEAAKNSGKKFAIMFNQRTHGLFAKAKEIVESGALGELRRSVWIITNWYRTQFYYDSGSWRATWAGEGGGVLMNQAPHQLDLWQWICGMPDTITAFCTESKHHNIEVEDDATIFARYPNGAEGVFVTSTGEAPGTNRLEIAGTKGKLVLENGVLKWWKLEQDTRSHSDAAKTSSSKIPFDYEEIPEDPAGYAGHRGILQNFSDAIRFDAPLLSPGYDGIRELTIQNAAYMSAWKGNMPVQIPFDEAEYDALLEQKKLHSQVGTCESTHDREEGYHARWQTNW